MNGLRLIADSRVSAVVLIAVIAWFVWVNRSWPGDDGLIYARYAFNLAEGYGLVYNPGEYYEGNTNFLWTLLLLPAFWWQADVTVYIQLLGIGVAAVVLWCLYDVVRLLCGGALGLVAVLLLGLHAPFVMSAPSGFAPHLPAMLVLAVMAFALRYVKNPRNGYAVMMTAALLLLLITRLDAVLLFAVVWLMALWVVRQRRGHLLCIGIVPPSVFAVYLLCKFFYYGDILPATYYAKIGDEAPAFFDVIRYGWLYLWVYAQTFLLTIMLPLCLCFVIAAAVRRGQFVRLRTGVVCVCLLLIALWSVYMVRIGGDGGSVGFRYMVTVSPFLFVLSVLALRLMPRYVAAVCVVMMLGASLQHYRTAGDYPAALKESDVNFSLWRGDLDILLEHSGGALIALFTKFSNYPTEAVLAARDGSFSFRGKERAAAESRIQAGMALRRHFAGFGDYPADIKIATATGGALPFYARLHTLEMHGWADARLFEEGHYRVIKKYTPGYQRIASPALIKKLGINLVFGYPTFEPDDFVPPDDIGGMMNRFIGVDDESLSDSWPPDMQFVQIPVAENKNLIALYFIRNKTLDDFFDQYQFVRHDIRWGKRRYAFGTE